MHLILLLPMFVLSAIVPSSAFPPYPSFAPSLPHCPPPCCGCLPSWSSLFLSHLQGESALRRPNGMNEREREREREPAINLLGQGFQTRPLSLSHSKGGHRYFNHKIIRGGEAEREREREREAGYTRKGRGGKGSDSRVRGKAQLLCSWPPSPPAHTTDHKRQIKTRIVRSLLLWPQQQKQHSHDRANGQSKPES